MHHRHDRQHLANKLLACGCHSTFRNRYCTDTQLGFDSRLSHSTETEVEKTTCAWNGMDIRKIGNIWSVVVGPIEREVDGKVTQPAIYFTNKSGNDPAVHGNEKGTKRGISRGTLVAIISTTWIGFYGSRNEGRKKQ